MSAQDDPGRGLTRRGALRLLGAGTVGALGAATVHPLVPIQAGEEWTPRFFDQRQLALVTELAEMIVPETDTPGARGALVHQYIDWVLSEQDEEAQVELVAGLDWVEHESGDRFDAGFLELSLDQRGELMDAMARAADEQDEGDGSSSTEADFFRELKRLTVRGYYRSEVGMHEELAYDGNLYLAEFEGCRHPEHHEWRPESTEGSGRTEAEDDGVGA